MHIVPHHKSIFTVLRKICTKYCHLSVKWLLQCTYISITEVLPSERSLQNIVVWLCKGDTLKRLQSTVPNSRELICGMISLSGEVEGPEEIVIADDYLNPHRTNGEYDDNDAEFISSNSPLSCKSPTSMKQQSHASPLLHVCSHQI